MASLAFSYVSLLLLLLLLLVLSSCFFVPSIAAARMLSALVQPQNPVLNYHNGPLLNGNVTVNILWYGKFSPSQLSILVDFLHSVGSQSTQPPSVSTWWRTTGGYRGGAATPVVGNQILDESCSLGKLLTTPKLISLASKAGGVKGYDSNKAVNVVLTAADVAVEGFCMSQCGTHGSTRDKKGRLVYAWVGNPVSQCPGQCAWPFHQPIYGPQNPPLVSPNGDVGVDGMVINFATVLAGTVTNPFDSGYFQGSPDAPLEAVSACTGIFGKGAYPGYPEVLVDKTTGASYNANGVNGRKYLLPAMWDPRTSTCKTSV
ncbi:Phosphate-induced protein [Trema orientale]|uniref:Phosphate-induced protein n=1 Tax=Trema orientale TaxID=63057 RepID=A0A2P5BNF9_TREOI|nr:Phosphate-induced protein [Trema orientale]